jgi:hypothetical protein
MKHLISPVSTSLLEKELTKDCFLRPSNFGNNEIYVITGKEAPNVLKEIGRLRELTFRMAGGGTGKSMDLDKFDLADVPYKQIVLWNPEIKEIIGGYRYFLLRDLPKDALGNINSAFTDLFKLSPRFIEDYLPYTIELGRSFVVPRFQSTGSTRASIYSLDNLWDALGALVVDYPDMKYFLGKMTMYGDYNVLARDIIQYFLKMYFEDTEGLIEPYDAVNITTDETYLKSIFTGGKYLEDYKILNHKIRDLDELIPPLFNSYMNLSSTMKTFGTAVNTAFGNVEETAIKITIKDIYEKKRNRHIQSYIDYKNSIK